MVAEDRDLRRGGAAGRAMPRAVLAEPPAGLGRRGDRDGTRFRGAEPGLAFG
jgi:hypothetical protein